MAKPSKTMRHEGMFTCDLVDTRSAVVHVYGEIGVDWFGDGIDPTEFVKTIDALDVDQLSVYVNSPGGDAFGGIAMMNALRRQNARVDVTVDGLAASAASYIAMGGDTLTMGRNSQLMIHDASGMCWGNASDMDKMSATLSKLSDSVAEVYAEKSGGTAESWRDIMRAETWYSADEAVQAGLADGVDESRKPSDDGDVQDFDLHVFNHAGRWDAPAPEFPEPRTRAVAYVTAQSGDRVAAIKPGTPADSPAEPEHTTGERKAEMAFMDEVRARLGTPDADEAGILAALDKIKTKAEIPEGIVMVDQAQLDELKAQAKKGVEAVEAEDVRRREGLVDDAIKDGRIPPARRDWWLNSLSVDEEGFTEKLSGLDHVIPTEPVGYTGGVDEADGEGEPQMTEEERIYAKAWGVPTDKKETR